MLTKSKIFLICCLVFILGIAVSSFLPLNFLQPEIWWFGAAIFFLVLAILFWYLAGTEQCSVPTGAGACFLFAAVFLLAVWRFAISLPVDSSDKIWHYNGRTATVRGYVANEPDIRENNQKLKINIRAIQERPEAIGAGAQNITSLRVGGKLLVTTNLYPEFQYGDELEMICKLEKPEEFDGFAYDRYLARYDIFSVCYWPKKINLTQPSFLEGEGIIAGRGNIFYKKIFVLKKYLSGLIEAGLTEPESSLARPIVFGGQKGLPLEIREDFQKVGLTHIMAVSGFNISIMAAIIMAALLAFSMSRGKAFYLAAGFLAVYIIIVGAPASALRAGLMGFLVLWALKLGRLNKMTNSLVLAAAILLMFNPKLLRDDIGFQLSFLAMAGLAYAYPILEALWQKIKLPKLKGLSDALLITLAAQVFTLPILAINFSRISLIAPLANLAALWAVPILTILILAALPLAALLPSLAFVFFLPSLILTKYILFIVKYFAKLPYASLEVDYFSFVWAALYYALVIFIIIKLRKSKLLREQISGKL